MDEIRKEIRKQRRDGADWIKVLTSNREPVPEFTQEELDAICAKCPLGQLYEDAEAQDLRIRERSERALREHIEGVRHAEDTVTALLGGHEALAYLAALRDGQILQENECEHYAAQIAEAGAAWETVLEGVSFEDLSRLRHLLREVDEYIEDGGKVVYLMADPREAMERAHRGGGRPMLQGDADARWKKLYRQRDPVYYLSLIHI